MDKLLTVLKIVNHLKPNINSFNTSKWVWTDSTCRSDVAVVQTDYFVTYLSCLEWMTIQVSISVLLVILFVVQNDPFYESRFKVFCQRAKKRSCVIFPLFVVSSAALFCHVTQRALKRESALRDIPKKRLLLKWYNKRHIPRSRVCLDLLTFFFKAVFRMKSRQS